MTGQRFMCQSMLTSTNTEFLCQPVEMQAP